MSEFVLEGEVGVVSEEEKEKPIEKQRSKA